MMTENLIKKLEEMIENLIKKLEEIDINMPHLKSFEDIFEELDDYVVTGGDCRKSFFLASELKDILEMPVDIKMFFTPWLKKDPLFSGFKVIDNNEVGITLRNSSVQVVQLTLATNVLYVSYLEKPEGFCSVVKTLKELVEATKEKPLSLSLGKT